MHILRRKLTRAWLAALVALAASSAPPVRANDAIDEYNFAVGLYKQERWDQAAEAFRRFAEQHRDHPNVPTARLYRGLALVHAQDYAAARTVLRGFAAAYPQSRNLPDALYRVAECSYLLDDLKAAEAEFVAFIEKYPEHEFAEWGLPYLADAQLRLDKPEAAAASFRRSLEDFPNGRLAEDSRFGLAKAHEALGQAAEAIRLYEALAANQNSAFAPQAQMSLAARYFDQDRFAEAAEAYAQLEARFPESDLVPSARLNAGYAWYQVGDFRNAIAQFERAARDESQAATARFWTGVSHKALGEYDQAAAVLKETYDRAPDGPVAETALYQWADSELRAGKHAAARERFLQVAERWPQGELADDALHFAAEAALLEAAQTRDDAGRRERLQTADELLARFRREHPQSSLWLHQELLQGRVLEAKGGEDNLRRAEERFRGVLSESSLPRTQLLARFHLGRLLQKRGDHAQAADVLGPVVEEVELVGAASEFLGALVLAGHSLLEAGRHAEAAAAMTRYLDLDAEGPQAEQALAVRAVCYARAGDKEQSRLDLQSLADRFPRSPLLAEKTHEIAEAAYDAEDYEWSAALFESLVNMGPDSAFYAAGLSGYAWSQHQRGNFGEAAAAFERFIQAFPGDEERVPEAAYMRGQSLKEDGRSAEAAAVWSEVLRQYAPEPEAPAEAEPLPPARFAWLAGLQAARTLRELKQVDEADAAYAAVLKRFPQSPRLDLLLDEWALLHYEEQNYSRADELFRRLVREFPDSQRADDARLHLAESDFIAGRLEPARTAFRELEARDAADALVRERALFQLMEIAVEAQDWEEVLRVAADLARRFPEGRYRWDAAFRTGEAELSLGRLEAARAALAGLRSEKEKPRVRQARWFHRIWVLLAETQVRLKKYEDVRETVAEFAELAPESPVLHQAYEVLGRACKNQAQWDEARAAFQRVLDDPAAAGSETAAKSQLMIAETWWNQEQYDRAQEGYLKVYLLYDFPEWQAPALFQAAACDEKLDRWRDAVKSYEDLLKKFPDSEFASQARQRLQAARQRLR